MEFIANLDLADWIGIVGSILIAVGYFAVSTGKLAGDQPPFQLLNLSGAILILYSLWHRPNAGAIVIEVLWVLIAVYSLYKHWRTKT